MTKRRRVARAQKRIQQRTLANAERRGDALDQAQEREERREQVRHRTAVEILLSRKSISPEQARAAARFEADFKSSGSVIGGNVIAPYKPLYREKYRTAAPDDAPSVIRARERLERAIAALGPLAETLIAVVIFDEPPSDWATQNGFRAPDGAGAVRIGLDALLSHYSGQKPLRRYQLAPPPLPAGMSREAPIILPEPPPAGPRIGDFWEAQARGELVDDATLRDALTFAERRGWLNGHVDPMDAEMAQAARQMARLARARAGAEPG